MIDPNDDALTPSGGVVEFYVWPLEQDIIIDGPDRWRRPASFVMGDEPVLRNQAGQLVRATEYLDDVMLGLREGHSTYRYLIDEAGQIADAPRIHLPST